MGHPRHAHKPRERHSKRARKQLRHRANQLAALKTAGANLAREHQKTMLWLLAVLKTTGGAVVTPAELLSVQAQFGRLGWQAVPDTPGAPALWTIRVVDVQQPNEAADGAIEHDDHEHDAEPNMAGADERRCVDDAVDTP